MKNSPKTVWNPERLDARAFAQAAASLEATLPLSTLERLHVEAARDGVMSSEPVQWRAHGEMRDGDAGSAPAVWLHLQADTRVALTCQRCLGPVQTPLTVDRWFRFVADEAAAEAEDDDCEEDLLALEPRPSLIDVLEDELLMELPLVPMHETCPVPIKLNAGDEIGARSDTEETQRKNPFAELARLKK